MADVEDIKVISDGYVQSGPNKLGTVFATLEEARDEAVRQASESNVAPYTIMVSAEDGYATGDGEIHRLVGMTAG